MTPVPQTKLVGRDGYGTCWTAALASMLDLPERAVPHFADPARFTTEPVTDLEAFLFKGEILNHWWAGVAWLNMLGYDIVDVDPTDISRPVRDDHLVACGLSPRSPGADGREITHAVIYARQPDGSYSLAHDPHPDGGGLVGEPRHFYAIRPLDR